MTHDISLAAAVRVPDHVVFRTFAAETVVLNLQTGKYHGLNRTAGRILELIQEGRNLPSVVEQLASEFDRTEEDVARDVVGFCRDLDSRDLIEIGLGDAAQQ